MAPVYYGLLILLPSAILCGLASSEVGNEKHILQGQRSVEREDVTRPVIETTSQATAGLVQVTSQRSSPTSTSPTVTTNLTWTKAITTATGNLTTNATSPTARSPRPKPKKRLISPKKCESLASPWTPWTAKWENIKGNGCGRRRRTRVIADPVINEKCLSTGFRTSEFLEDCNSMTRSETAQILQFYFVDEIFGRSSRVLGLVDPVLKQRRKRRSINLDYLFGQPENTWQEGECPDDPRLRPEDFLIMLDKSGSLSKRHFKQLVRSMITLIRKGIPAVSREETRVAMMTFSNHPSMEFNFNDCMDKACLIQRMQRANSTTGGLTRMAHALLYANSQAFTAEKGMRSCSRKVILLVTDGTGLLYERIHPREVAAKLKKDKNVEIFVLGVSHLVSEHLLQAIASRPVTTHRFYVPTTREVRKVFRKLKVAKERSY